jgi:succinyl-CoA synthetase beta subunit
MNIHEYQAKELFRRFQIPVPAGQPVHNPGEVAGVVAKLGRFPVVLKAQIHAGGRGKTGGIRFAFSGAEAEKQAGEMLGMNLVTPQSGKAGKRVNKLLIEERLDIARELYLGILSDRATARILIVASMSGGVDIEDVAAVAPEKIIKIPINPLGGLQPYHLRELRFALGLDKSHAENFASLVSGLYRLFTEKDCTMLEINPLVVTADQRLIALDAKIDIDSSALYRQPEIRDWRDESEEDPLETEAARVGLNYINLGGNIGSMVNGAGLAMATMDLIKKAGGEPANFLDVGGGADAGMIEKGFRLILGDPKVKAILINIFGGILRCDVLAEGVVAAARKTAIAVPVIIRMEGTNIEEGRGILADSGLNLITVADLAEAAARIAAIAGSSERIMPE